VFVWYIANQCHAVSVWLIFNFCHAYLGVVLYATLQIESVLVSLIFALLFTLLVDKQYVLCAYIKRRKMKVKLCMEV
jgi:hypothetical protein